jgi:hypothetical protein
VPPAPARRAPLIAGLAVAVLAVVFAAGYYTGRQSMSVREVMSARPAEAQRVAFVREGPCDASVEPKGARCQTLWVGTAYEDAEQVAALAGPGERIEEIAWARDGYRVGFLVNGYQLRIFDADSRKAVNQVHLVEPSGTPSSRIARGITFSQNGAAVTFDDCPRYQSGCRSGLMAVR